MGRVGSAALGTTGALALLGVSVLLLPSQGASADPATLCGGQAVSVAGGTYIVQNNEYNSGADECLTTDGGADFTVARSNMANPPGAPGGYPSIYQGCHWGSCSTGGLATDPVQVANLTPGQVTTSWNTTQTTAPGTTYDAAYDVWFNHAATSHGAPDCAEVMIWLGHQGDVRPYGTAVATNVQLGGIGYTVWEGVQTTEPTISYEMTTPATSVSDMDLYPITQDAVSRGYIPNSCYLIAVEAGFELWQGGVGLATNSFSVEAGGGATAIPSAIPITTVTQTATATATATAPVTPSPSPSSSPSPMSTSTPTVTPTPSASPRPSTPPSTSPTLPTSPSTPSPSPSTTTPARLGPSPGPSASPPATPDPPASA